MVWHLCRGKAGGRAGACCIRKIAAPAQSGDKALQERCASFGNARYAGSSEIDGEELFGSRSAGKSLIWRAFDDHG